ncbi:unnamed protein product [Rotaria sp. Silwood2]|nr:unnamed protein product [Rotaria sp. Silwood2]
MSGTKHTTIPIQPGSDRFAAIPDEISCVFRFGKDDHYDPFIKYELTDIIEKEENSKKQADNIKLSAAAYNDAIMNIENQLKLSSSLQVHSFDGSLISVFNSESTPSASSTYTNLEPSLDIPIGDTSFIQQILDNTNLSTPLPDIDFESDLFDNFPDDPVTFDQLLNFDPIMTIQPLTDVPMEQSENYSDHEVSSSLPFESTHEETTISSVSSQQSDYSEHDDVIQRKVKKTSGPAGRLARFGNKQVIKYSDEYHSRRVKNNEAVKKSRMKAKEKQKTGEVQMNKLTEENRLLNDRVDLLMQEIQVLRSLYKGLKPDSTMEDWQPLERIITP